jgi:hypothetical protein
MPSSVELCRRIFISSICVDSDAELSVGSQRAAGGAMSLSWPARPKVTSKMKILGEEIRDNLVLIMSRGWYMI